MPTGGHRRMRMRLRMLRSFRVGIARPPGVTVSEFARKLSRGYCSTARRHRAGFCWEAFAWVLLDRQARLSRGNCSTARSFDVAWRSSCLVFSRIVPDCILENGVFFFERSLPRTVIPKGERPRAAGGSRKSHRYRPASYNSNAN